ncbi:MAG TPA: hypothetical protein DCX41_05235 [Aequorivita sp.]|nr:hypothetical protein [Aequorivita sp.]|tara:strand:+ start:28994 stop:29440 length:447 start_codon:yes stop_codon:yes gene_type:complete
MSEERVKTYCGNCAKETYQGIEYRNEEVEALEILAKDDEKHKTESMWIPGFAFWQVSKCLGCEKLTFMHVLKTSHDPAMDIVSYFPKYHLRPVPEWYRELPIRYLEILKEVYTSIHHGSFILSLMGSGLFWTCLSLKRSGIKERSSKN